MPLRLAPVRQWAIALGPKALAGRGVRSLVAALVMSAVAVLLYRGQPEAGFAVLAVLASAAGWLLAPRLAGAVALVEISAVAASTMIGFIQWPSALLQACLLATLIALTHVAAKAEPMVRHSAALERRLAGLGVLLETVENLATARDRDEVLKIAVHASARGISRPGQGRTAHAAFHSVVGEQVNISVVADDPVERDLATGFEYPIVRNQAARGAIRIGRPAFVRPDHMSGPLRELSDRLGWQVLIMAPVYCGGLLQGLLAATARDGPVVDRLQQYMLGTLARFTSLSLEAAARASAQVEAATQKVTEAVDVPALLPSIVNELRAAVTPIKSQILDLRASRNGGTDGEEVVVDHALARLDGLISTLASRTAIDATTGILTRELGLAALERDLLRARRSPAGSHSVAVLKVATPDALNPAELIRLVADRLRSGLRREDLIFRYSEDEIVCSFSDMDNAGAYPVLNRIQSDLASQLGYSPFTIGLTAASLEETAG